MNTAQHRRLKNGGSADKAERTKDVGQSRDTGRATEAP